MHHASAAGSRTPTPAKSDFARLSQMAGLPGSARWPKTQSPTDGRQALAEISLNQRSVGQQTGPQSISSSWQERQYVEHKEQQAPALTEHSLHQSHAGMQAALKSTNMAWQPHQSVLQYGSDMPGIASRDPSPMAIRSAEKHEMQQTERQHEQLQTVPVQQQSLPRRIGQRQEESSRQNKQLRWAGTARQLQQGSEQPAKVIGSSDWAVPSNQDANCGQQCSIQYDRVRACDSVTLHQDKSMHAEELQVLAQMLEPTGSTLSRGLQSLAYSATMQGVMPGSWWEVPHTHDPHHDAAIAGSSLSDSGIDRVTEDRQYATEVPRHMQSPHTSSSVQRALTNHHAMQQLSAAPHDGSVGKIGSMHCRAGLAGGEMHDLPAGIPLTPIPDQEPHPRDSLEASIWKLSGNGRRRTAGLREASAAWTSRGRSPRRYRAVHEQKQPSGAQGLSQPVVQDRLEASLRLLAARQERTGCAEST